MIEFTEVQAFAPVVFDSLFAASLPALDAGGYRWDTVELPNGKLAHYRDAFQRIGDSEGALLWQVKVDGIIVMYNAGTRFDDRVYWRMALVGNDQFGSTSFFYRNDYTTAEAAFWASLGVTSHVPQITGPGTPIHSHYLNRASNVAMEQPVYFKQMPEEAPYYGGMEILVGLLDDDDEGFEPFDIENPGAWRQPVSSIDAIPIGAVRAHNGGLWESTVENNVWEPGVANWRAYVVGGGPAPWSQPSGATDAYQIGDRVTYQGSTWVSTAANNVWAPGVFGWTEE
jgi:hypothetical protein